MKGFPRRHRRTFLGAALGAAGGALYAHFIGCRTGSCAITSNAFNAALFFGFTGGVVLSPERPPCAAPRSERKSPPAP
jgi:hypothetical protein